MEKYRYLKEYSHGQLIGEYHNTKSSDWRKLRAIHKQLKKYKNGVPLIERIPMKQITLVATVVISAIVSLIISLITIKLS